MRNCAESWREKLGQGSASFCFEIETIARAEYTGPDPHVARPKAHGRCEAPPQQPLTNPTPSRFYHFLFTRVIAYFIRTLKKTKIHTLLTFCSQILSSDDSFLLASIIPPSPSFPFPSSPFFDFILSFSPFSLFFFSFLSFFLPSPISSFPSS